MQKLVKTERGNIMSKIKNENYVTIQGWMINELGLKGNELFCFAIIYGFSQITGTAFTGSYQYLADWCNTSRRTIINVIDNLESKGYIIKNLKVTNRIQGLELLVNEMVVKNFHWGSEKISPQGSEKISPNNIDNKNNNRLIDNNKLEIIFKEKGIYVPTEMKEYMNKDSIKMFEKMQDVISTIYSSPVYKKYIPSITYDDLVSMYEKYQNARNVKNDILYMKRILLEQKRKEITRTA